ncbi:MAG: hypothetical protein II942_01910 [Alphaproteobacteria bacterium]|nr:hypothetical protein [Alphaproteobacteria bacterium]
MKKVFFTLVLLSSFPCLSMVAPEEYMVDPSCPKNAPFKYASWNDYEDGDDDGYYAPQGKCISCNSPQGLMLINEADCKLCPNRIMDNGYCRLKKCPTDKPFYEEKWNWSGCKSCADQPTNITKEECAKCPSMRWLSDVKKCAPNEANFIYYDGEECSETGQRFHLLGGMSPYRFSCQNFTSDFARGIVVSAEECAKCPNTYMKNGCCLGKK